MSEIEVVIVENTSGEREVCVFTDRDVAVDWFTRFHKQGKPVSIHSVEVNSSKDFIQMETE